jgi:hypothetical protein
MVKFKKKLCEECKKERNHIFKLRGKVVCGSCKGKVLHQIGGGSPVSLKKALEKVRTIRGYTYKTSEGRVKSSGLVSIPQVLLNKPLKIKFENPEITYDRIRFINGRRRIFNGAVSLVGTITMPYRLTGEKVKIELAKKDKQDWIINEGGKIG